MKHFKTDSPDKTGDAMQRAHRLKELSEKGNVVLNESSQDNICLLNEIYRLQARLTEQERIMKK